MVSLVTVPTRMANAACAPGDRSCLNDQNNQQQPSDVGVDSRGNENLGTVPLNIANGTGTCGDLNNNKIVSQDTNSLVKSFCVGHEGDSRNIIFIIIQEAANYFTGLLVFTMAVVIAIAGIQMSASAGNPQAVAKARKTLMSGIGMLILVSTGRVILDLIGVTGGHTFLGVDVTNFTVRGPNNTLVEVISAVFNYANYFAGIVSVAFVIVGGIRMMTSSGNPQAVQAARKTIAYALGGLAISVSAFFIIGFVSNLFR